jgi:hypothetical protein
MLLRKSALEFPPVHAENSERHHTVQIEVSVQLARNKPHTGDTRESTKALYVGVQLKPERRDHPRSQKGSKPALYIGL